ncbi:MAG: type II secretion system protein [Planctomycetes bacterium]|nr:type II secretion system protein [Planctomycetota bacterium]
MRRESPSPSSSSPGFTLVELIVVLVIIAAVSGLVIPSVAALGRSTDMAASAKTQQDLANNLQQFFVLQKRFPQGCDSLLVDTSTLGNSTNPNSTPATPGTSDGTPDGLYAPKYDATGQQISGMTTSNPALVNSLTVGTLSSNQRASFGRGGFEYVYDHEVYDWTTNAGIQNSNNSGTLRRALPGGGTLTAAVVNQTAGAGITTGLATTSGKYLLLRGIAPAELVPGTTAGTWDWVPETGTQIVAVGIGQGCRLVPTTMLSAPVYPGDEGTYYGRYVAFFKVYESGERPTLLGVSDCYGRTSDYTILQFNQSLPNGGRQG